MYSIHWFFGNKNNMSDKNNDAAPSVQGYKFSDIKTCVKYLNEDKKTNQELNDYFWNQLTGTVNIYNFARTEDALSAFKPCLVCKFVKKNKIMESEFDFKKNPCQEFDEVILDFKTVYKVIQNRCELRYNQDFGHVLSGCKNSVLNLIKFINEEDKDKKISCLCCVEFIGCFKENRLKDDFINRVLEITNIDNPKIDKSRNVYCIRDAIRALSKKACIEPSEHIPKLLDMIFSVQDFSLFLKAPEALCETIYYLIVRSEKYIRDDQVGAIRDVLENGELYKKFRDGLEEAKINFDMQSLENKNLDDEDEDDVKKLLNNLLRKNSLVVSIKDGEIILDPKEKKEQGERKKEEDKKDKIINEKEKKEVPQAHKPEIVNIININEENQEGKEMLGCVKCLSKDGGINKELNEKKPSFQSFDAKEDNKNQREKQEQEEEESGEVKNMQGTIDDSENKLDISTVKDVYKSSNGNPKWNEEKNAAPNVQEYRFNNINDCVKYLNENKEINRQLNIYLCNQLNTNEYNVAKCSDEFEFFKPYLICKFVNEKKIMNLNYDYKICKDFDEVILDFDTVCKIIQNCSENTNMPFIECEPQVLSFINENDKGRKISRLYCVDFIGRFKSHECFKALNTDFVKRLLEITDINNQKVGKSKNVFCIADAINALTDEFCNDPELLNMIFSVQDFSLFSEKPQVLYTTIYSLIVKSEKYIKGDQVGAIRDVLENGTLYKKFREELGKVNINFDMWMLIESGCDLAMLLFANNLAVSIKDGKITIEERGPELDELILLLQKKSFPLNEWIAGVTGTKLNGLYDKNIDRNRFEINSFEDIKNLKVKLIKSYIEHNEDSETLKKAFKPLLDLEGSNPEQFNKLLNEIKLSEEAIKSVFQAIELKDKLTGEQFDDFKKTIRDLCFGIDKPLLKDINLLTKFGRNTLTSKQMEELLNLSEPNQNKRIVTKAIEVFPILIWRLKNEEVLPKELLDYFYKCNEYLLLKSTYSCTKDVDKFSVSCFCNHIWHTIIHSSEYIKENDAKKAIETVLSNGKEYEPFREFINHLVIDGIKFSNNVTGKINLGDMYKEENRTFKQEGQEPWRNITGQLVDFLDENHFKLTFDKGKLKLESTLQQLQKDDEKVEEKEKNREVMNDSKPETVKIININEEKEQKENEIKKEVKPKIDEADKEKDKGLGEKYKKENQHQSSLNIKNNESSQTNSKASKKIGNINNLNQQDYKSQNINLINTESQNKPKAENLIQENENINSFGIISNVKKEEEKVKENEQHNFKNIEIKKNDKKMKIQNIEKIDINPENKSKKESFTQSELNSLEIINNIKQKKVNFTASLTTIQKTLLTVATTLFALGLLVLLDIIFPVVPVKSPILICAAMIFFSSSGISAFVFGLLYLKEQSKNIGSMAKSLGGAINKENEYVNPIDKNITQESIPISGYMLGEQINKNDQKGTTEKE